MAESAQTQDLTVKGESIERIYGNYVNRRYIVNRRYQRKLVWTLDEKRSFIDSISKGYPVPIFLLAEKRTGERSVFEIIDGMQRLNSVMSFVENEFSLNGEFFDLNTMAESKALLDSGRLVQGEPVLAREMCVRIAAYTTPLSIFESADDEEVDEVFRRINSGGRKLSRQELRGAGSIGHLAEAVRLIASSIRGDVSASNTLLLNDMKNISISNKELPYGIDVATLFWTSKGVLTREQVRESRDEELIADMLAYLLLDPKPASRSEFLDDYFGFGEGAASALRLQEIENAVQRHTIETLTVEFDRVFDVVKSVLSNGSQTFCHLLFGDETPHAPRYFQVVFLALYKLVVEDNQEVSSLGTLAKLLTGIGSSITIQEGGRWGSQQRANAVNGLAGTLAPVFQPAASYDPAKVRWITQLENILNQSFTEQAAYDFKQGLVRLDGSNAFDEDSFEKILKTLVGIANLGRGVTGYVIVGVSDKQGDAQRVLQIFGATSRSFERFHILGIEHEADALSKTLDQYFQLVTQRISRSVVSEPLRDYIARNVKLVRYYDKSILILQTQAQAEPSTYGDTFYSRQGNSLIEIPVQRYSDLFRRFQRP